MKIVFVLLALAILATAAPPSEKQKSGSSSNKSGGGDSNANKAVSSQKRKPADKQVIKTETKKGHDNSTDGDEDNNNNNNEGGEYCYDSSYSFKCRQTSPNDYELECKIVNADGAPCFPDVARMIEAAAPLSTISYPIHSFEAQQSAANIDIAAPCIVTADNIEAISLQAPFERIPADAFAALPHLKRITLESLDGVRTINVDRNAFRNTTAKHLHLIGHDVRHILAQHVDMHNFNSITFSDVEIDCREACCRQQQQRDDKPSSQRNVSSCERLFDGLKSVETLNLESIYVHGEELDERVFHAIRDSLKKLTVDVVYKRSNAETVEETTGENAERKNERETKDESANNTASSVAQQQQPISYRGYFPVETFAFMSKLEDLEVFLYEPIIGFSVNNDTPIPLPVSKSLERMTLSCRYCKNIDIKQLGKMLPNLRHLTIAAPLERSTLEEESLKFFTKLEELVIYDGNLRAVKAGAFRGVPSLKHLSIKYAEISEFKAEHLDGLEKTLESLSITGTPIKRLNVSDLEHLTSLDISQNRLTTIERGMLPEKAQLSELNISYNPIKQIENGCLSGVGLKNHAIRFNGLEIESFDFNALEGIEKLTSVDLTQNFRLRQLEITDYKKIPAEMQRIVVGRSPYLQLDDEKGNMARMLTERNITLVVEGQVACCCKMNWIIDLQKEHPELIEIDRSRAVCSRQGTTDVEGIPDSFWKKPTLVNFFKTIKDEKAGLCKGDAKGKAEAKKP